MNLEQPPVKPFTSPFELTLMGMCIIAIAVVVLAVCLLLTDTGVVNW